MRSFCLALCLGTATLSGCGDGALPDDDAGAGPPPTADLSAPSDGGAPVDDGGSLDPDGGTGSAQGGSATISGIINGYTVTATKSVVAVLTGTTFNVYIADRDDLCTIMQMGSSPRNTSMFRVGSTAGAGPHTFPAGIYTYPSGIGSGSGGGNGGGGGTGGTGGTGNGMGTRNAVIASSNDNCEFTGYDQASTGSFTLSAPVAPDATVIDGTFDVTFDIVTQTGRFTGSFHAPVCPRATDIPYTAVYCE